MNSVKKNLKNIFKPEEQIEKTEQPEPNNILNEIKELDFTKIPENFTMMFISKRGCGKTHLMRYVLSQKEIKNRFEEAYLFSGTAHLQKDSYNYIPEGNRYNGFDENIINGIFENQELLKEKDLKLPESKRRNKKILLILDDVVDDPNALKSKILKTIFTRGRHANISLILLTQTISARNGFPAILKNNTDVAFSFIIHSQFCRETFVEQFLSIFDKKEGMEVLNKIVTIKPYMAICIIARTKDNYFTKYSDFVYKIKAPEHIPNFSIGLLKIVETKKKKQTFEFNQNENDTEIVEDFKVL